MQYLIRMLDMYPDQKKEYDLHWRNALSAFGPDATKENRYCAKRGTFNCMFGGGYESGAKQIGIPVSDMKKIYDAFHNLAPQYDAWDKQMRAFVKNGGRSVEAYSGRQLWMDPKAEWGAGNTVIQGTARELAVDATLKWMAGPWGHLTILIVHDELVVWNVPVDEAAAATEFLIQCMTTEIFGVQIRAEANEPSIVWQDAS
jgi:DNA polymerase-1